VITATLTVRGLQAGDGYEYHHHIQLKENAGVTATITGIAFSFYQGGALYGTVAFGPEAWNSTTLGPNGSLESAELVVTDEAPTAYIERSEARIAFSDASATSRSVTVSADVPGLPLPPPGSKFKLTGTVKSGGGSALRDVKIEVRDGSNAGRNTKTDSSGKYTLSDLKTGTFNVRASKADYSSVTQSVALIANKTLNFSLEQSNGLAPELSMEATALAVPGRAAKRLQATVR
jgi:hypothetical protein